MLLAAGLGTRLHPLTEHRPKPIVPLANRPLAGFAMEHLVRAGVTSIVANTHPMPELVENTLRAHLPQGAELTFSREATLLGTGGGLRAARAHLADTRAPVVVMNGDTLFAPNLERALAEHLQRGAVATMILRPHPDAARFGGIGIDPEGWVKSLLGAPDVPVDTLMFTGVHILSADAFNEMPEEGCVIRTAYRRWVDLGAPVLGIVDQTPWADLGTLQDYHRMNLELAAGSFEWPGIDPIDGNLVALDRTAPEARSSITHSVVGEGVTLARGATLDRCVVWPGSVVETPQRGAIVTPWDTIAVE